MDVKGNSLYQEMQAMAMQASAPVAPMQRLETNASGSEFSAMLTQAVNNVNGLQGESRELQKRFEMGDPDLSLVDVMVAKEKSGIAFEATVQVRNKLLEAYKTIMNMPV
jgi:flagellar hook-basal body complex protein FliE